MIVLQSNNTNTVRIKVNASIDVHGFSLVLAACGTLKTITDITDKNLSISFTAEEVSKTSETGTYGELIVYDGDGKEYIKLLPLFKRVPQSVGYETIGNQMILLTISSTKWTSGDSSGGDTPTPAGDYVTPAQMSAAINSVKTENKQYTDEAVSEIETTIIENQPVQVVDSDGQKVEMTVQEAVQQIVQAQETHLHGGVKDEDEDGQPDDEMLYLNTGKGEL